MIEANGIKINCRIDGKEGAPWLVFSNSLACNVTLWDDQVARFAADYRILRYDQRGHGGTPMPPGPCTMDILVEDAAALIAAAGAKGATFVGISMGAATAFGLATRHPGLVERIVPCDGQSFSPPSAVQIWEERIETVQRIGLEKFAPPTLERWFAPESVAANHPAIARVEKMICTTPVEGFIGCGRALEHFDYSAGLSALKLPVLLIAGEKDGVLPATLREVQKKIPGSRFAEIPGARHLPNIEKPEAFNRELGAFLAA